MALPLSPQVFAIMSHLIEERTGLHYAPTERDLLAERISSRAVELGLDSLLDYYYYLRYGDEGQSETDVLVDLLVVNETYFFREIDQLRAFVERLLPRVLAQQDRARVWCAASSSGEEPLTLAMLLEERGLLGRVDIVASDISARVLARAKEGVYRERSCRVLTPDRRAAHFVQHDEADAVRVRRELVRAVRFERVNLFDFGRVGELGVFDAILCRNALIYFRDESVMRLITRFSESLVPRGVLMVGASESLLRFGTLFECEEHGGAFFYRKGTP